ncbi:MAG: T9SS type A sorting domain-containing protein, partial [candidate division Zixibacteria bacterium]|nr:T9SS type A sorting domain-containing protein [candidate division Zixibacteria bacterium]
VTLSQVCGPDGAFVNVNPDSGYVAFRPDQFTTYEFCFEADDGCNIVTGSFLVDIILRDDCDVCLRVFIDGGECTPVGLRKTVELNIETNDAIAGFDILLNYDPSALTFISAYISGSAIDAWEYFTYNVVSSANGLIRLVGIADVNNGPHHPPTSSLNPQGTLVYIEYQVANDQNLGDVFVPISFIWYDCGDNTFSDVSGTVLFLDSRIYNAEGILIWDEEVDPDSERPFGMGASDDCLVGSDKGTPLRCIEFFNGGVCIIHPDSLDDRGDINLNNIAYEIGDAVLFTNYFIYGLKAFTINVAGQIAATDVNADGITLTVSDLAYLVRVIIGDASPYPKLNPYQKDLLISSEITENGLNITTEAVSDIGAAYFVYDVDNGVEIGEPALTSDASGMDLKFSVEDGQLKMLVYNIGTARIPSGTNRIIEIPVNGEGGVNLTKAEIVDYQGQPYVAVNKENILPTGYSLSQNFPNPFNPSTRIQFSLPQQAAWTLKIFNITGKLVREFNGVNDAGVHEIVWNSTTNNNEGIASGVYFYRLEANDFIETKKMILLK